MVQVPEKGTECEHMPGFAFMKILESVPERYDRGITVLSRGRIQGVYEMIAATVGGKGRKVLDIGCGTGNLTLACAATGASVAAIDINAGMLEVAKRKAKEARLDDRIQFIEIGVAETKSVFVDKTFDACVSCLAFGELTRDEQAYAISMAFSLLKQGGTLMIADEVTPRSGARRFVRALSRAPVKLLAYVLTQSVSRPVDGVLQKLEAASFTDIQTTRTWGDSFMIVRARKGLEQ